MRYLCLLTLTLFIPVSFLTAKEPIFKQLAVAETDFEITISDIALKVTSQGITLRAVSETAKHSKGKDEEEINDFAYRAYHLEFAFERKYKFPNGFDVVEFYKDNDVIHRIQLTSSGRKFSAAQGRLHETNFMAISLEGIPLIMLDSVDRINFRKSK